MAAYLGHHNLPKVVGGDATHVVVHRGQHGDRLLGHVHTSENRSGLGDARQALVQHLRGKVVQVQVDVVLVGAHATTLPNLHGHGSGHDVTGGQVLGIGGIPVHGTIGKNTHTHRGAHRDMG